MTVTEAPQATETNQSRAEQLEAARKAKRDELFGNGRKYEVLKAIDLPKGEVFRTPFGNKGRHGFALREVGNPDHKLIIGATLLRQVAEEYGAVELPEKTRKRRTPEEKEADEAARKQEVEARKAQRAAERAQKMAAQAQIKAQREAARAEKRAAKEAKLASAPKVVDPLADL